MTLLHRGRFGSLLSLGVLLMLGACGDTAVDTPQNDVAAYCDQAAALDEQEEAPTEEQFNELVQAAPEEIEPMVQRVADRYGQVGFDAFGEPEVEQALQRLEEWEEQNCP